MCGKEKATSGVLLIVYVIVEERFHPLLTNRLEKLTEEFMLFCKNASLLIEFTGVKIIGTKLYRRFKSQDLACSFYLWNVSILKGNH